MKGIAMVFSVLFLFVCNIPVYGQDSVVSIRRSQLTAQQISAIEQQQVADKIQTYGKWVGFGKEVGEAVNGSLSAVTEQTSKFAQTGVGRLTVALVIWKVVGDQAVHFVAGFAILMVGLAIWIPSYRRCSKRVDLYDQKNIEHQDSGKPDFNGELATLNNERLIHLAVFAGLIVFSVITIFSY
jgi:hypothetical protein